MERLPQLRVSSMKNLTQGFNFIVSLNEFTYGFENVSGFTIKKNVEYIKEGGVNDHQLMVGEPQDDRPTLTFKRGLVLKAPAIISNAAKAAAARIPNNLLRKTAMLGVTATDPQEALESGPAVGLIQVYSRENKLRALYSFFSLGMIEWNVDDLDAGDSKILIESITVAHTGLTRMPVALPSIVGAIEEAVSDSEALENAQSAAQRQADAQARRDAAEELKSKKAEELALWRQKRVEEKAQEEEKAKNKALQDQLNQERM